MIARFLFTAFLAQGLLPATLMAVTCSDKIAQMPLDLNDPDLGRWVAKEIEIQLAKQEGLTCKPFIEFEQSLDFFDYISSSFFFKRDPDSLGPRQIDLIALRTGATHILHVAGKRDSSIIRARLYKIEGTNRESRALKLIKKYVFVLDMKGVRAHETPAYLRLLALLSPNALTTGFTTTMVNLMLDDKYELVETTNKGLLPAFISSVSVNKIEHSAAYNKWDLGASLFPGVYFFSINQTSVIREYNEDIAEKDRKKMKLHVKAYGSCGNFNLMGTLHTPIGATYGAAGYGPCLLQSKEETEKTFTRVNMAVRLDIGHRVFVTKKFYTFLDFDFLFFSDNLYRTELAKSNSITRYTLGMGWYLTDAEGLFIKSWRFIF